MIVGVEPQSERESLARNFGMNPLRRWEGFGSENHRPSRAGGADYSVECSATST